MPTPSKNVEGEPYNRLVLIGNGFDKALGLHTGYPDFILDLLKKVALERIENPNYQSSLIGINDIGHLNKNIKNEYLAEILKKSTIPDLLKYLRSFSKVSYAYVFLDRIMDIFKNARWVDIEQYYYETLKREFKISKKSKYNKNLERIIELNKCMVELTIALNIFIKEQEIQITMEQTNSMSSLLDCINDPLRPPIASLVKRHGRLIEPSEVLFLNFNYTNTVKSIISNSFEHRNDKHLFIHGSVNNEENPIIFGYGDDTGEEYKELEIEGENELLRKIKSFQYPRTHNYHKLLNYLYLYEFDVFVIGHSCGLSDRTLLKTIFEHPNCLAIQNFHYQGELEDFEKRMEISRHFDNKVLMRERVLPFDETAIIPQKSDI